MPIVRGSVIGFVIGVLPVQPTIATSHLAMEKRIETPKIRHGHDRRRRRDGRGQQRVHGQRDDPLLRSAFPARARGGTTRVLTLFAFTGAAAVTKNPDFVGLSALDVHRKRHAESSSHRFRSGIRGDVRIPYRVLARSRTLCLVGVYS